MLTQVCLHDQYFKTSQKLWLDHWTLWESMITVNSQWFQTIFIMFIHIICFALILAQITCSNNSKIKGNHFYVGNLPLVYILLPGQWGSCLLSYVNTNLTQWALMIFSKIWKYDVDILVSSIGIKGSREQIIFKHIFYIHKCTEIKYYIIKKLTGFKA